TLEAEAKALGHGPVVDGPARPETVGHRRRGPEPGRAAADADHHGPPGAKTATARAAGRGAV
ncbi:hypothetical protein ABZT08_31675, partial [Streptomyces sp. NPDC005526]|uniref:hypothetical protein n=1 Tax=Streptomyces sp. NPDC005526 TaxID=3156885 RepID=UPI0033ABE68B